MLLIIISYMQLGIARSHLSSVSLFLPAGHTRSMQLAGPKITLHFSVSVSIFVGPHLSRVQ